MFCRAESPGFDVPGQENGLFVAACRSGYWSGEQIEKPPSYDLRGHALSTVLARKKYHIAKFQDIFVNDEMIYQGR